MSLLCSALLDGMSRRATLENPRIDWNNPADWDSFGATTGSGVSVNRDKALTYSPVWRAVTLISRDVAKLPLLVYKRVGEGKERDKAHPAFSLLRHKPNEYMTGFIFKQVLVAHAVLGCGGFAYIERDGAGRPLSLLPLNPDCTHPVRDNGRLMFVTEIKVTDGPSAANMRKLPQEDVFYLPGLSMDGIQCYDLVKKARERLGVGMAQERYTARFFGNDGTPSLAVEFPGKMKPEAATNFLRKFNEAHQGLDNAHKAALLQEGMKIVQYGIKARDAQLSEVTLTELIYVANFFGIPPSKLGHPQFRAYASLEQEQQNYLDEGLDPWLVAFEEEAREKLLSEEEKDNDTHAVEFLREAMVRANLVDRSNYYKTALGGRPWMSQNEVRSRENLNPIEGGDEILDALDVAATGQDTPGTNPPASDQPESVDQMEDDNEPEEANATIKAELRVAIRDAMARMIRRVGAKAETGTARAFMDWVELFPIEHRKVCDEALGPLGRAFEAASGERVVAPSGWLLARLRGEFAGLADRCQPKDLAASVKALVTELESRLPDEWEGSDAD